MSPRNFCSEVTVFLLKKGPLYVIYHISESKNRQKQKQIGSMTKKMEILSKKVILKCWSAKVFSVPSKLGAKSPSMATRNNHIMYDV